MSEKGMEGYKDKKQLAAEVDKLYWKVEGIIAAAKASGESTGETVSEKRKTHWAAWEAEFERLTELYNTEESADGLQKLSEEFAKLLKAIGEHYDVAPKRHLELVKPEVVPAAKEKSKVEGAEKRKKDVEQFFAFAEEAGVRSGANYFNAIARLGLKLDKATLLKLKSKLDAPADKGGTGAYDKVKGAMTDFLISTPGVDLVALIDLLVPHPSKELLDKLGKM